MSRSPVRSMCVRFGCARSNVASTHWGSDGARSVPEAAAVGANVAVRIIRRGKRRSRICLDPRQVGRLNAGESYKKPAVVVRRDSAEAAVRALLRAGLLDPTRKIRDQGEVVIPVRDDAALAAWAEQLGARLVEDAPLAARDGRRSPREEVVASLAGVLPPDIVALVPDKWEQHGDVLVLRLPERLRPHARAVGAAFARALDLKSVLDDEVGVRGELREMSARLVWGTDPVAIHVENEIAYR